MFNCVKFDVAVLLLSISSPFVVGQISFEKDTGYENDACDANPYSSCQKISNCPSALKDIKNGVNPKICRFDDKEPLICCDMRRSSRFQQGHSLDVITVDDDAPANTDVFKPHVEEPTTMSTTTTSKLGYSWYKPPPIPGIQNTKCVQKCREYGYLCIRRFSPYVFGGEPAKPKEFPHMALIGFGPENDKSWQCGGSVISTRYILSAAHCTFPGDNIGYAKWVRLGDLDYSSTTDDAKPEDYTIIERINHPGYKPPLMYNDIALYKVNREIVFNDYIRPVCLHTTFDISARVGKASGWGRIEFVGPTSSQLLHANITFVKPENCKDNLKSRLSKSQFPDGLRTDSLVCAGEADGSKDTCQGDSGGPLFIHQTPPWPYCLHRQVGITSTGLPCSQENSPGLYTRVSKYVPWIESIVWENDL